MPSSADAGSAAPRTASAAGSGAPATGWAERIELALEGEGVTSVFQPIVDLRRCSVVGYEALTRFEALDGVRLGPDQWFEAAAALGVGPQLDAVALASALKAREDLPPNCFMTVNVDPESLLERAVTDVLAHQGHLGGVIIEITEHRPWDWSMLDEIVARLRSAGALFAVDDAGAGYSGLQQILQLRPSILKLDRSLVEGIDRDEAKRALVDMLGVFANRVDAWVLAEGIETRGEALALVDLQVPLVQGYYFGRPGAPWVPMDPAARAELAGFERVNGDNLFRLVDPVAAIGQGNDLAHQWLSRNDVWIAVVDHRRRPCGLLNAEAALSGELLGALVVNVHTSPRDVAHRLSTQPRDPAAPVVVTDNAGRYLGLVSLRRLLGAIATTDTP